jgi:hypothetical protein
MLAGFQAAGDGKVLDAPGYLALVQICFDRDLTVRLDARVPESIVYVHRLKRHSA